MQTRIIGNQNIYANLGGPPNDGSREKVNISFRHFWADFTRTCCVTVLNMNAL